MKFRSLIAGAALLLGATLASTAETSLTGWITDSKCGAEGAHAGSGECAAKCVKAGAKYVFVNDGDKKVYVVDPQEKVSALAGQHVSVKGSVDGTTLKVSSISESK